MPKKKTELTIEERLQQALVPAEEQPYEVPENWVWTYISSGFDVTSSKRVHKSDWLSEGIPFYRTRELVKLSEQGYVDNELFISEDLYKTFKKEFGVPQKNDLLISGVGTIGVPYVISDEKEFYFKDGNVIWLKNKGVFDASYMYYLYKTVFIDNQIHSMSAGTTVDTYTIINAKNTIIPLSPLSEQQRIVERIEELFAKLDEAKERLQEVADSFAVSKAAILHKAFTGELIEKQVTELVPLENLVDLIKIGPFGSSLHESDYIENGIPLVNPKHIVQQRIVPQSKISISDEKAEELSSYKLKENDIVLGRRREMGRCAPISSREENWICGTGSMIIRLKKEYDAKLYSLILGSQATVTYLENSAVGSTLKNLNEKIVRKIPVPQFSSEEQHEIVRLIDDLLARERVGAFKAGAGGKLKLNKNQDLGSGKS